MKQFKNFIFSALFLSVLAFAATSCQSQEEPFEADAPQVQATLGGYGSCGSCPLPSTISGTLPAQLYPTSDWMVNLENCFEEDLADLGRNCEYRTGTSNTLTQNIEVYLQFSTNQANTVQGFCSYFYQCGNALASNKPSGNWMLESINYMSHISGSYYRINVTWRAYICQATHIVKVK